jgi:hypothetical protein
MMQVGLLLLTVFKDRLGTRMETSIMFGTLVDGMNESTWWRRVFISQADFIKKFSIAYALVYMAGDAQ